MKRILIIFLAVIFLFSFSELVCATERIVQLTIPGCSSCGGTFGMVGSILKKSNGIKQYEYKGHDLVNITFDDERTTLNIILDELKKGEIKLTGNPVYIK